MVSAIDRADDPDVLGSRQDAIGHLSGRDALDATLFDVVSEQEIKTEYDRLNSEKQEYEQYDFTDAEQLRECHLEDERYWELWTLELFSQPHLMWLGPDDFERDTQEWFRQRVCAEDGVDCVRRRSPYINVSELAEWAYYSTHIPHALLNFLFGNDDGTPWLEHCLEIAAKHYAAQRQRNTSRIEDFSSVKQTHDFKKEGF